MNSDNYSIEDSLNKKKKEDLLSGFDIELQDGYDEINKSNLLETLENIESVNYQGFVPVNE